MLIMYPAEPAASLLCPASLPAPAACDSSSQLTNYSPSPFTRPGSEVFNVCKV